MGGHTSSDQIHPMSKPAQVRLSCWSDVVGDGAAPWRKLSVDSSGSSGCFVSFGGAERRAMLQVNLVAIKLAAVISHGISHGEERAGGPTGSGWCSDAWMHTCVQVM